MWNVRKHSIRWAQAIRPSFLTRNPHFNFITLHYFWIIGWTILGSILIFASGKGRVHYIDALVFAAGANTQAGLNPIDLNLLNTFQQLVIYFCTLLSNPITIHSSVVFLRLYWFEKRFQHIVQEARLRRSTISKTRSKGKSDAADVERGINTKDINVVRDTGKVARLTNDGLLLLRGSVADKELASDSHRRREFGSVGSDPKSSDKETESGSLHIKFANELRSSATQTTDDETATSMSRRRTNAEHIAILEKQRKAGKSVLRIPGPRDADMGALPEEFEDDPDALRRRRESSLERPQVGYRQSTITIEEPHKPKEALNLSRGMEPDSEASSSSAHAALRFRGRGGRRFSWNDTSTTLPGPLRRIKTVLTSNQDEDPMPYLSWHPTIGRNSQFVDLTEEQREELGGIEYRSLKTLALVLVIYFVGYSVFGIVTMVPWIVHNNPHYGSIVDADGVNRVWWGFWTSNAAFMDLGYTLTPDSMLSFNTAIFPLLIMSFLIILGNTGFPVALRFMIWLASLVVPRGSGLWEELRFLLDHPRRCFTLLFPSNANWWLFSTLIAFNGIDLILFLILDLGYGAVAELPWNIRVLDGWFQATSTRTAGFSCIEVSQLHPAVQVSYLIMMYIAIFPVAISIRKTNVYEEKSLGLYSNAAYDSDDSRLPSISYLGTHLRRQLSFDLWYVFLGFFILNITEAPRIRTGDISMFAILFEIVSAYGTVGVSLGYPGTNASLLAQFSVLGKLVIAAMMIRGRHRGLPYGLDRAVLLPSEYLNRKEAEDAELRSQRRQSGLSVPSAERRPSSGRTSEDRPSLITQFLHLGPAYSMSKVESAPEPGSSIFGTETLRRHTSATSTKFDGAHDQVPGRRKTAPQIASAS
ncbi:cation transport protein-domain-containing protein [Xylaria nigripes]|nr:cation transport protein-domain-containing protein [Xylaria nigripes]